MENATVAVYPRNIPKIVTGIRICEVRLLAFHNKYISNVTPITQPTCGRELKTIIIEMRNPHAVKIVTLSFNWSTVKRSVNTATTQNSVALSLNPRTDQIKWLGRKARVKIETKNSLGFCWV
jgi:hypothetical protein